MRVLFFMHLLAIIDEIMKLVGRQLNSLKSYKNVRILLSTYNNID
jgi:hypothetical protein